MAAKRFQASCGFIGVAQEQGQEETGYVCKLALYKANLFGSILNAAASAA